MQAHMRTDTEKKNKLENGFSFENQGIIFYVLNSRCNGQFIITCQIDCIHPPLDLKYLKVIQAKGCPSRLNQPVMKKFHLYGYSARYGHF